VDSRRHPGEAAATPSCFAYRAKEARRAREDRWRGPALRSRDATPPSGRAKTSVAGPAGPSSGVRRNSRRLPSARGRLHSDALVSRSPRWRLSRRQGDRAAEDGRAAKAIAANSASGTMATGGGFRWPPLGGFTWPLSRRRRGGTRASAQRCVCVRQLVRCRRGRSCANPGGWHPADYVVSPAKGSALDRDATVWAWRLGVLHGRGLGCRIAARGSVTGSVARRGSCGGAGEAALSGIPRPQPKRRR
jgi:hypothetical protein